MILRVLSNHLLREHDNAGDGHYHASRDGGTRLHRGVDLVATFGQTVTSPFSGVVKRVGVAYNGDNRFRTIHIKSDDEDLIIKILYVRPIVKKGDRVTSGQPIGTVQDLTQRYAGITNHLHIEVLVGGAHVDPTPYLFRPVSVEVADLEDSKNDEGNLSEIVYSGTSQISASRLIEQLPQISTTKKSFLETSSNGVSNNFAAWQNLNPEEKGDYDPNVEYPISVGTKLHVKRSSISQIEYSSNITITKASEKTIFPEVLRVATNSNLFKRNSTRIENTKVHVMVWNRSKHMDASDGWIDVSEDVRVCSVQSSMNDSNFSFEVAERNTIMRDGWYKSEGDSINRLNLKNDRSKFFYQTAIQQNDLVFIRFEKLSIESEDNNHPVSNRWYDMIGLVDAVSTTTSSQASDVSTIIRGRDLSKVLIDDNSYFNPFSIGHVNSQFGGVLGDRYDSGEFFDITPFLSRSINETVKFIVERIASINYIPSEIFSSWENPTQFEAAGTRDDGVDVRASFSRGVWSIIKVFIDDNVQDLRLVDDSITNPNGSIWGLFGKIAQAPFVEYFGDVYGDQYFITMREPPHTYNDILNSSLNIESSSVNVSDENLSSIKSQQSTKHPRTITIRESDVISDNLSFDTTSYAWYSLEDRGNFAGKTVGLGVSPNLYLEEYAQVFGNKRWEITSNYSNYKFHENSNQNRELDLYADQQSQHLSFMVETTMYLPFSRKGTITINGDRRIKKGSWIYYEPTNEICYVTGTMNVANINNTVIDRTTQVTVERCLVKDFIDKNNDFSYFNIIDIEKLAGRSEGGIYDIITRGRVYEKFDQKKNIIVNPEQFNFFLKRRQLDV